MYTHLKTAINYLLIQLAGLGTGYAALHLPQWLKPAYVEGDYKAHYQANGPQVVVYGTQTCPYCAKTREMLNSKQVKFNDRDVQNDEAARKQYGELGGKAVPVILIG